MWKVDPRLMRWEPEAPEVDLNPNLASNEICVYVQKEDGNRTAYIFEFTNTIEEVKREILRRTYHSGCSVRKLKQSWFYKAEREKIRLSMDGEDMNGDEAMTLQAFGVKEDDVLKYVITKPLAGTADSSYSGPHSSDDDD